MSSSQTVSYSKRANFDFQNSPFSQKGLSMKYHSSDMSKLTAPTGKTSKPDFASPSILSVSNLLSPIPVPTATTPSSFANPGSKLDLEPNPFEQSFGTAATDVTTTTITDTGAGTPKSILPPISSIDSPQPKDTYAWGEHSLRSGPLSPSMLIRPQNQNTLSRPTAFSPFGTQPSPMTAALLGAAGQVTTNFLNNLPNNSLQLKVSDVNPTLNSKRIGQNGQKVNPSPSPSTDTSIVNRPTSAFSPPTKSSTQVNNISHISAAGQADLKGRDKKAPTKSAKGVPSKSRGSSKTKSPSPTSRRKSTGSLASTEGNGDSDDDNDDPDHDGSHKKAKNDDPEEKRKNFLERNRQAALKCRQRKKQWLNNLQGQVEYFTQENEQLQNQATALREEIINLKTLLIAHKDCPVAQSNGVGLDLASLTNTIPGPGGNPQRINPTMSIPLMPNSMNPPLVQSLNGVVPPNLHSSQMHPNAPNPNMMRF
ncbi:Transcription factor [Basidiobolus ranarum]|uniref:Transcription factor n=1 Tax=Basidiobolus ranarum TaxID=34480 RepID=A0ABR2W7A8_9FUNG